MALKSVTFRGIRIWMAVLILASVFSWPGLGRANLLSIGLQGGYSPAMAPPSLQDNNMASGMGGLAGEWDPFQGFGLAGEYSYYSFSGGLPSFTAQTLAGALKVVYPGLISVAPFVTVGGGYNVAHEGYVGTGHLEASLGVGWAFLPQAQASLALAYDYFTPLKNPVNTVGIRLGLSYALLGSYRPATSPAATPAPTPVAKPAPAPKKTPAASAKPQAVTSTAKALAVTSTAKPVPGTAQAVSGAAKSLLKIQYLKGSAQAKHWILEISNLAGKIVRTYQGIGAAKEAVSFDFKADDGGDLPSSLRYTYRYQAFNGVSDTAEVTSGSLYRNAQ